MTCCLHAWVVVLGFGLSAALHAASPPPVKKAATAQPVAHNAADGPRSVIYRRTLMTVTNEKFGTAARGYFCSSPVPFILNNAVVNAVSARFASAARRELKALGYTDSSEEQSAFARNAGPVGDYEIAGSLREIEANICFDPPREANGGVWLQMRWELFAAKAQRVVYSLTTEGSFSTGEKWVDVTSDDFFERAFVSALKNALADPTMSKHLRGDPSVAVAAVAPKTQDRLALAREAEARDAPDSEFTTHRSAVVTVMSGVGTGSGFYIDSASGHLLTNHHVVGDSKYVKVRLASGRELVGEVMRSDSLRDVALVKTETVAVRALPVTKQAPAVGEEMVAIGSPYGESFASSVSKGVLSGSSTVKEQKFLQSDVKVLPGSSGGPLIRRDGSVVGIVQGGVGATLGATVNLFIPIDDALERLAIDIVKR